MTNFRSLITGGSGFIGARLAGLIRDAGGQVTVYDKRPDPSFSSSTIVADVRDVESLSQAANGVKVIYHLAAEHRDDVTPASLYDDVNVGGAHNVVAAARKHGCKTIIFTSSVAIYPLDVAAPTEDHTPAPFNRYGESKLRAEQTLLQWAREEPDATLVIIRPCVVFGEGNRGNVYNLLKQIHSGRFLMVGSGTNKKSMAYVGNLAKFLAECVKHSPGTHIYNYADKPDLSIEETVSVVRQALGRNGDSSGVRLPKTIGLLAGYGFDVLAAATGRKFPLSSIRIKKFCADTSVSTDRLENSGFHRPYTLQEALKRTVLHEFGTDRP